MFWCQLLGITLAASLLWTLESRVFKVAWCFRWTQTLASCLGGLCAGSAARVAGVLIGRREAIHREGGGAAGSA